MPKPLTISARCRDPLQLAGYLCLLPRQRLITECKIRDIPTAREKEVMVDRLTAHLHRHGAVLSLTIEIPPAA